MLLRLGTCGIESHYLYTCFKFLAKVTLYWAHMKVCITFTLHLELSCEPMVATVPVSIIFCHNTIQFHTLSGVNARIHIITLHMQILQIAIEMIEVVIEERLLLYNLRECDYTFIDDVTRFLYLDVPLSLYLILALYLNSLHN